jgi:D-alanine--poly(phosphoribitol) ligase subunit 1
MQLFIDLQNSLEKHKDKNAFFINGDFYTYSELTETISRIRKSIQTNTKELEKNIGIVANDDLETYASIFALWFEGKAYVPISPETPKDRNENIIQQALIKTVIDSSNKPLFPEHNLIESQKLPTATINLAPKNISNQELAYVLFTSGTTGQPKGVPITRKNLTGFIKAFETLGFVIDDKDRFLQMFELTFDLSVMSYLIPILCGACVYTIPKDKIKYSYIFELMDEQKLTFSLMVPSMLHYLRPYFNEISAPEMKYSLFCGEALPLDVTKEWSACVPNAKILNVYGPTEDTIFCTEFSYNRTGENKSHNGVISIGKATNENIAVVINENNQVLPYGNTGQLCLAGIQLTPGYWNNEEKNKEVFFYLDYNGKQTRFYKTGDLCYIDKDGDILYIGRSDNQIKVQGFRIELSEIEFHIKTFLKKINAVAVAMTDALGNTEIGLIIESNAIDIIPLQDYMKAKMPAYMIPKKIEFTNKFPLNTNGKTDRNKLALLFAKT